MVKSSEFKRDLSNCSSETIIYRFRTSLYRAKWGPQKVPSARLIPGEIEGRNEL